MRLTITGADSLLGRAVIASLAGTHTIRAVDLRFGAPLPPNVEAEAGDLRDRDFATRVTDGANAVLHLAPLSPGGLDEAAAIDAFTRGSFNLADMAIEQGVRRFLLGSTLALFDRLPAEWRVDENWRPRPEPTVAQLAPWLSELSMRECCRTAPIRAVCLRFAEIVAGDGDRQPLNPRQLHIHDAVQAVRCGLRQLEEEPVRGEWEIYHISGGERAKIRSGRAQGEKFGYKPEHGVTAVPAASQPAVARPGSGWRSVLTPAPHAVGAANPPEQRKRRVVLFGSGGPVAAALADELKDDYILRQTDVRPLAQVRGENHPQSEGAPLPTILGAPHEERTVDVRDYNQVLSACDGMDVIVNCTVVRPDAMEAFRVNTLGAYNVVRAAVASGIRRVVQTGPQQMTMDPVTGYWWDYDVPGNVPSRPGRNLYAHSKFLGQEICRVFSESYDLEIPVLVYAQFLNPDVTRTVWTMAVSWRDSARALRRAIEVETLPSPYEEMAITSDLPSGKFSAARAKELLGWEAQDDLSALWAYRD
jgi:nucleoside-diphosphate-sugar epimerase